MSIVQGIAASPIQTHHPRNLAHSTTSRSRVLYRGRCAISLKLCTLPHRRGDIAARAASFHRDHGDPAGHVGACDRRDTDHDTDRDIRGGS